MKIGMVAGSLLCVAVFLSGAAARAEGPAAKQA